MYLQMTAQVLAQDDHALREATRAPAAGRVRQGEADEAAAESRGPQAWQEYSEAEISQCFDFAASRLRVKPDPVESHAKPRRTISRSISLPFLPVQAGNIDRASPRVFHRTCPAAVDKSHLSALCYLREDRFASTIHSRP